MTFRVLYVCTGNVCRSPMAELMFRSWRSPDADAVVGSVGTAALVGSRIDPPSAAALAELGIIDDGHRGRQYRPAMVAHVDLVLTAQRAHRDRLLTDRPTALHRTFTMKEFARLARHLEPGDPADVVASAANIRAIYGKVPIGADDVPDPYRGTESRAREVAAQISDTVRATLTVLGFARDPAGVAMPPAEAPAPDADAGARLTARVRTPRRPPPPKPR